MPSLKQCFWLKVKTMNCEAIPYLAQSGQRRRSLSCFFETRILRIDTD